MIDDMMLLQLSSSIFFVDIACMRWDQALAGVSSENQWRTQPEIYIIFVLRLDSK
jgi:hypothetical protein